MTAATDPHRNQRLAALPPAEWQRWRPQIEGVDMPLGQVLYESGRTLGHVYFPVTPIVSLLYVMEDGASAEIAVVGFEGVVGSSLFRGGESTPSRAAVQSAGRAVVQGPGTAWRIGAEAFAAELVRSAALRHVVYGYLAARMAQLVVSAACLRFHLIGPRLARWLLLRHDRAQVDRFGVTQEFLAQLLGVRRVGITTAECREGPARAPGQPVAVRGSPLRGVAGPDGRRCSSVRDGARPVADHPGA